MKKLTTFALVLVLTLTMTLAACGGGDSGSSGGSDTASAPPAQSSDTTPPGDSAPNNSQDESADTSTIAGKEWPDNEFTGQVPKPSDPIKDFNGPVSIGLGQPEGMTFIFTAPNAQDNVRAYIEQLKAEGLAVEVKEDKDVSDDIRYRFRNASGWLVSASWTDLYEDEWTLGIERPE